MDFVITVRRPDGAAGGPSGVDLRVRATASLTVGDLEPHVARALGMPRAHLAHAGVPLPDEHPCGTPPVVHGACLTASGTAGPIVSGPGGQTPPREVPGPTVFDLVVAAGPDCGHRVPLPRCGLDIGRGAGCDLVLTDDGLSRRHARVDVKLDGVTVRDLDSTNGIRIDGRHDREAATGTGIDLRAGTVVGLGNSLVELRRPPDRLLRLHDLGDGRRLVAPTRANGVPLRQGDLTRPPVPSEGEPASIPLVSMLIPLPIAAVLAWFFGPQFLLFGLLGPVTAAAGWWQHRVRRRRGSTRARVEHRQAVERFDADLDARLAAESRDRASRWPDAETTLSTATMPLHRLWARTPDDPDFLIVRLGWGQPLATSFTIRRAPDHDTPDEPRHRAAPVSHDLRDDHLCVLGPQSRRRSVIRHVLGQVATWQAPDTVRLVVLDPAGPGSLPWTRWLPHLVPAPGGGWDVPALERVTAEETPARVVIAAPEVDRLDPAIRSWLSGAATRPHLSLLLGDHSSSPIGAARLVLGTDRDELITPAGDSTTLVADGVGRWWGERLARTLAPLTTSAATADTALTPWDPLPLDEGASPSPEQAARAITQAWRDGTDGLRPARALVGSSTGLPWHIDLDVDGPHILIGGTTGSGKSEVLRALISGLALTLPPEQVTFLLVDYKGGSTFHHAQRLPHTVGVVTDLDGGLATRALRSLRAEIRRRERLLADAGVADLHGYAAQPGPQPLARLVVVVDEFRVLALEQPDFLEGLVRLAAVGRSMGIHLVLATQRPAGAITPDIQANVNLRIALRVRDPQDSHHMIGSDDAARLDPAEPGTGFARSGDGTLTRFRTLHLSVTPGSATPAPVTVLGPGGPPQASGGPGSDRPDVEPTESVESRVVDAVIAAHDLMGALAPRRPWLPPLPERLPRETLDLPEDGPVPVGLVDLPDEQHQAPLEWSPGEAPWRLVGGPASGRSSALATIVVQAARRWPAEDLEVYVLSDSPTLAAVRDLPVVGAVIGVDDPGRLVRLLSRLEAHTAGRADGGPRVLLVVDDWERFIPPAAEGTGQRLESVVRAMAQHPHGAVLAGGGRALGAARALTGGTLFLLGGLEPADLLIHGIRPSDLPQPCPPGRAVDAATRQVVHFGDPRDAPPVRARSRRRPRPVLDLPRRVDLHLLPSDPTRGPVLGIADDRDDPIRWDTRASGPVLLVAGPSRSGRTGALRALAHQWAAADRPVVVLDAGHQSGWPAQATLVRDQTVPGPPTTREGSPTLVVVDDADLLPPDAHAALTGLLDTARPETLHVVASARTHALAGAFRGPLAHLVTRGHALLLRPASARDGDPLGVRIEVPATPCPGRGVHVSRGRVTEIQVPWVDP